MTQQFDPVSNPDAYRRSILAALGDDDPVQAQTAAPGYMRDLVADAGALIESRPEPNEWSALECLGHIVDSELIASVRYRWILAEDQPPLVGYEQGLWVSGLAHGHDDPALLLELFTALRRSNLDLWARRSVEDRARVGIHVERGPESYELTFRLVAGHDRVHLGQARRALDQVRGH
jgi:DinB superfamily